MPSPNPSSPGLRGAGDVDLPRPSLRSADAAADDLEALNVSAVILGNLADTTKRHQPKYRQLRLSNKKIQKLWACSSAARYLTEVGFAEEEDGQHLRVSEGAVTSLEGEGRVGRLLAELRRDIGQRNKIGLNAEHIPVTPQGERKSPSPRKSPPPSSIPVVSPDAKNLKSSPPPQKMANLGSSPFGPHSKPSGSHAEHEGVVRSAIALHARSDPAGLRHGAAFFDAVSVTPGQIVRDAPLLVDQKSLRGPIFGAVRFEELHYHHFLRHNETHLTSNVDTTGKGGSTSTSESSFQVSFVFGFEPSQLQIIECVTAEGGSGDDWLTLRTFVETFHRLYLKWRESNADIAKVSDVKCKEVEKDAEKLQVGRSRMSSSLLVREGPVRIDDYAVSSYIESIGSMSDETKSQGIISSFVDIIEDIRSGKTGADDLIRRVAQLQADHPTSTAFLDRALPTFSIMGMFTNSATNVAYYTYKRPGGLVTSTFVQGEEFLADFRSAKDDVARVEVMRHYLMPLPTTFLESKKSTIATATLGLQQTSTLEEARTVVETAIHVIKTSIIEREREGSTGGLSMTCDVDKHEALGPFYDLRGMIICSQIELTDENRLAIADIEQGKAIAAMKKAGLQNHCAEEGHDEDDDPDLDLALRMSLGEEVTAENRLDASHLEQALSANMVFQQETTSMWDEARESFLLSKSILDNILDSTDLISAFAAAAVSDSTATAMNVTDSSSARTFLIEHITGICGRIAKTYHEQISIANYDQYAFQAIHWYEETLNHANRVYSFEDDRIAKLHWSLGSLLAQSDSPSPDMAGPSPTIKRGLLHLLLCARSHTGRFAAGTGGKVDLACLPNAELDMEKWIEDQSNVGNLKSTGLTEEDADYFKASNLAQWAYEEYLGLKRMCKEIIANNFYSLRRNVSIDELIASMKMVEERLEYIATNHPTFSHQQVVELRHDNNKDGDGDTVMKAAGTKRNECISDDEGKPAAIEAGKRLKSE